MVFCHGLFGQGKQLDRDRQGAGRADHRVPLVDMPDHGRSPWSDHFDYLDAADQVAELSRADDPVALVGHSMGGKIAMLLALRHPELVERLVRRRRVAGRLRPRRPSSTATSRRCGPSTSTRSSGGREADEALREAVPDPTVRGFLLQNLRRDGRRHWRWQPNLERARPRPRRASPAGPRTALAGTAPYDGPVLWVGGADSDYVRAGVRRGDGPLVPAQPPGHHQGRRPLGALRAAGGLRRGAAPVPRPALTPSAAGPGRPRRRCGCRTSVEQKRRERLRDRSSTTPVAGVVGADRRAGTSRRRGSRRSSPSRSRPRSGSVERRVRSTAWMCQSKPSWRTSWGTARASPSICVDQLDGAVAVGGEQRAQPRPEGADGVQLGPGAVVAAGVAVARPRPGRGRPPWSACPAPGAVDQGRPRPAAPARCHE